MCTDGSHPVAAVTRLDDAPISDPYSLEPVDSIRITSLVDNSADLLLQSAEGVRRSSLGGGPLVEVISLEEGLAPDALVAEHGFSALVEITKGSATCRVLFDAGLTPNGMVENMRRLDIEPGDVDVIVLSHGHFDHTTGLDGFIRSVGRSSLPVLIHPHFWRRRRLAIPGAEPIDLPTTSRAALTDAGFEIIERPEPSFLLDGSLLVTGEVDRTTSFETGFGIHEANVDGAWVPDPLILDDQALIAHVRGRGLFVLTGCGHAGVVNLLRYARRLTGVRDIHAVMGGFHLAGRQPAGLIDETVTAISDIAPDLVVPAHCTGWRASHAIATAMPDAFVPNAVGTVYTLGSL
jgi:7,8-dihydropterin-6-yl-methyl-4-(beta-D-ribofuranosyl)aminobenzene 5'-phosphate synthase